MKDTHLIIALYRALDRYGSSTVPHGDAVSDPRSEKPPHQDRRRSPGWVTVAEIEASQSPNTYPRLTRRDIHVRCENLSKDAGSPVRSVERAAHGLRTWVLVAPPGEDPSGTPATPGGGDVERDVAPGTPPPPEESPRDARTSGARQASRPTERGGSGGFAKTKNSDALATRPASRTKPSR